MSGERTDLLGQIRLPGLGLHHSRDRAAAVLVQQSVRRLPGLRRARHQAVLRSRAGRARRAPEPCARARSRPGRNRLAILRADARQHRARTSRLSTNTPWKDLDGECAPGHPVRLGRQADHDELRRRRNAAIPRQGRSRASSPTWSGAGSETDSAWLQARSWRATRTSAPCEACHGQRLKPEALAVKIGELRHQRGCRPVDPGRRRMVRRA